MGLTSEHYRAAKQNGISKKTLYSRVQLYKWDVEEAITKKPREYNHNGQSEFAVYKGEELVFIGTAEECLEHLNISRTTFNFYLSPSYLKRQAKQKDYGKRKVIVKLDDAEDDEDVNC